MHQQKDDGGSKETVPPTGFFVGSLENYNAMRVMTEAMPNLQQLGLCDLGYDDSESDEDDPDQVEYKWSDGEDPDERYAARTANWTSHDIGIISNFSKLRKLGISASELNGRYPLLFNSLPLLQKLTIYYSKYLKWDLEMLAGFPLLKKLESEYNDHLTGNINSLRVLKDTLEKVRINGCPNVEGNIMDLSDFPRVMELNLLGTTVTGDIRDIGENDFPSLEKLDLPKGVFGISGSKFQRLSDGPGLIRAVYHLNKRKQRPALSMPWYGMLSENSPDWYEPRWEDEEWESSSVPLESDHLPPFKITFVEAGSRLGYRWEDKYGNESCEVNWLDPEPDRDSSDYEIYVEELRNMRQVNFYRGFHQPPTEEEYQRLCDERGAQ